MSTGYGFFNSSFPTSILVVMAALIIPADAPAGDKPGPVEIAPREWGSYRSYLPDSTDIRWTASWVLDRVEEGPPAKYVVHDELRGRFGEDDREQTRVTEAEFIIDRGQLKMQHSSLTVRDRAGKIILTLEKDFDYAKGEVRTRSYSPLEKKPESDEFDMGDRLVDAKAIVSFLRGFPFPLPGAEEAADPELEFIFLDESPDTYSVLVTYEGIEDVETPAGKFSCHKLRLIPDLGILTFLGKMLAPDIYMWFTVEPPHFWVKFLGLEGGLGTPSVISELVEFNMGKGGRTLKHKDVEKKGR